MPAGCWRVRDSREQKRLGCLKADFHLLLFPLSVEWHLALYFLFILLLLFSFIFIILESGGEGGGRGDRDGEYM